MSDKREEILVALVTALQTITDFKNVLRKRPTLEEFGTLPDTNFPFVAVAASLPVVEKKIVTPRTALATPVVKHVWKINVGVTCYAIDNVIPDTTMGKFYDLIHKKVYAVPVFHKDVEELVDESDDRQGSVFSPYFAFTMKLGIKYHTHIGI